MATDIRSYAIVGQESSAPEADNPLEMALDDLTEPTAVLKAIEEADTLGRQAFLDKYGFNPSRE